jgi:hypothetical protein
LADAGEEINSNMSDGSVRVINREILGLEGTDNLITQIIPSFPVINLASFQPGHANNAFTFGAVAQTTGRLGIFAAEKNNVERAVIMLLPQNERPDGVLICITQGFGQAARQLNPLGWGNPLSYEFVHFALLKHVINRWGLQTLASRRNLAFMYILRARGNELGPFAHDGPFLQFVLEEINGLTNDAFSYDQCEAFTFSSGIYEFNTFLAAAAGSVNINAVYAIDPVRSIAPQNPNGGRRRMYASGTAGGFLPGFEPMPLQRWRNEDAYDTPARNDVFNYLHNRCMPWYVLYLALQQP